MSKAFELETKDVKLPSGLKVKVKRPGVMFYKRVFGSLPVANGSLPETSATDPGLAAGWEASAGRERERQADLAIDIVVLCAVEPRFSRTREDGAIYVDDLSMADFDALATAISEFADLKKTEAEVRPT